MITLALGDRYLKALMLSLLCLAAIHLGITRVFLNNRLSAGFDICEYRLQPPYLTDAIGYLKGKEWPKEDVLYRIRTLCRLSSVEFPILIFVFGITVTVWGLLLNRICKQNIPIELPQGFDATRSMAIARITSLGIIAIMICASSWTNWYGMDNYKEPVDLTNLAVSNKAIYQQVAIFYGQLFLICFGMYVLTFSHIIRKSVP